MKETDFKDELAVRIVGPLIEDSLVPRAMLRSTKYDRHKALATELWKYVDAIVEERVK